MAPPVMGQGPLWRRLVWFAVIWAGSVGALGIVGFVLRSWLKGT